MSSQNEHLLVIGGSKGIGFQVAKMALERGFEVTIASRSLNNLEHAQELLPDVDVIALQVNNVSSMQKAFASLSRVDHIFYSAGSQYAKGKLGTLTETNIKAFMDERVLGPLFFTKTALTSNAIKSVTYISGMLGIRPKPETTLLSMSCAMIDTFVQSLAIDYPETRFNSVSPGVTLNEDTVRDSNAHSFFNQKGHTTQVASLALEIIKNAYVNGANLPINGAQTLA